MVFKKPNEHYLSVMQRVLFFSFLVFAEIWYFYESYLQYEEYFIFRKCLPLHTCHKNDL